MTHETLRATIAYPKIERKTYHWIELSTPSYNGKYDRGTTLWEKECLDTANGFMRKLVAVPKFIDFFASHNYCVKKQEVQKFLSEQGSNLVFPTSREYREPFSWSWCQLGEGVEHPGHILDAKGWIYDKVAIPEISIMVSGKKYFPFSYDKSCICSCLDNAELAWDICESSAYNVPELYRILKDFPDKTTAIYECLFDASYDVRITAVLKYLDTILPTYEIIVDEDTILIDAGIYPVHILDRNKLHDLIRINKHKIKSILCDFQN